MLPNNSFNMPLDVYTLKIYAYRQVNRHFTAGQQLTK